MARVTGLAEPIDKHPQRDKIIGELADEHQPTKHIAERYGLNRDTVARARKRLKHTAGAIVQATLMRIAPPTAEDYANTVDRELTAVSLVDDLQTIKAKLRAVQRSPGLSTSALMTALEGERRTIESLMRMAELAERHRDVASDPRYQRLQAILAVTMRRHPDAAQTIREELRKRSLPDDLAQSASNVDDDSQA